MRIALCRWKATTRYGRAGWVPDCDLVGQPGFGVIDLRAPDNLDGSGVCIAVDTVGTAPIPGALLDLGDDEKARMGPAARTALANRLGITPTEATPGRIAAEILINRADGKAWCNPLQRETGSIRDRITVAGQVIYDSLPGDPEAVNTYYPDDFNRANATLSSPWSDPSAASPVQIVSNQAQGQFTGGSWARYDSDVGSANMFAQAGFTTVTGSSGGPCIRFSASALTCYQFDWNISGGDYVRWAAGAYNYISTPTGSLSGSSGVQATLYLQCNGSTLLVKVGANSGSTQTDTNIAAGQRGGLLLVAATSSANAMADDFAAAQIGETASVWTGNPNAALLRANSVYRM
jgi:hypothetical protein